MTLADDGGVLPLTPMEREYPTICAWTRHQTVSLDALREELTAALAWLDLDGPAIPLPPEGVHPCPSP